MGATNRKRQKVSFFPYPSSQMLFDYSIYVFGHKRMPSVLMGDNEILSDDMTCIQYPHEPVEILPAVIRVIHHAKMLPEICLLCSFVKHVEIR